MIKHKTHVGHIVDIPTKQVVDYVYKGGNDFAKGAVEIIDLAGFDVIEGDGHVSYKHAGLLDLLSRQRAIASDVLFHTQQKRNTSQYLYSIAEEEAKKVRAQAFMRLSKEGWAHKTKSGEEIKASSGVLDKIVDGSDEVVEAHKKLAEMQRDIDNLNAKAQSLERFYFNVDSAIKTIAKMLNLGGY